MEAEAEEAGFEESRRIPSTLYVVAVVAAAAVVAAVASALLASWS